MLVKKVRMITYGSHTYKHAWLTLEAHGKHSYSYKQTSKKTELSHIVGLTVKLEVSEMKKS